METTILGYFGVMEKKMETTIMGYIGVMDKKMETTIMGYIGVILFPVRYLLSRTGPELLFYYARFCYCVRHTYLRPSFVGLHSSSSAARTFVGECSLRIKTRQPMPGFGTP